MASDHQTRKKVSEMFFNDPERGRQVIERIHQAKKNYQKRPRRKKTSDEEIEIIPDEEVS